MIVVRTHKGNRGRPEVEALWQGRDHKWSAAALKGRVPAMTLQDQAAPRKRVLK
jgi:hypothetical protein